MPGLFAGKESSRCKPATTRREETNEEQRK